MTYPIRKLVRTSVIGTLLLMIAGCSSTNPKLYTIAPVSGVAQNGGPRIVVLDRVEIARYLDRSQIVRSSENYRLEVRSDDWWGEPLATMVSRVLRQELSQRLQSSANVLSDGSSGTAAPDATIALDIQRLDQDGGGNVILQAQASVSFKGGRQSTIRSFQISVPSATPDASGEVAAISTALGQLADGLATMLAGR